MEIIYEIIEYADRHNLLTPKSKRKLREAGIYAFKDVCNEDADAKRRRIINEELDRVEDELDRTYYGEYYHPRKCKGHNGKWKSSPDGPELKVKELNQLVQEEWNKLVEEFPRSLAIWDSWKKGKLKRVLTDGFTLNDVYALMNIEFRDYRDLSGPESTAYRQLLRQVGNSTGKYSWIIKSSEMVNMVEFHRFRLQVLEEVRTLYETDRERFALLSSQNGKLNFPFWEKAVQIDTASMKVWKILNLYSKPVTPDEIETIQKKWKPELAISLQLNLEYMTELLEKLEMRDWSSFTVITERKIEKTTIKSAIIPDAITTIRRGTFSGCISLRSVSIPDGVTKIGREAFLGCSSLTSVEIPESVTEIGERAFLDCAAPGNALLSKDGRFLLSVNSDISGKFVIPESVKYIAPNAFCNCRSLTSVEIPEDVTEIGSEAFKDCISLTSVEIPEGVTKISRKAFIGCNSLTSVSIPDGVTAIGDEAFFGCRSLASVDLPKSLEEIGERAFLGCKSLTSLLIPDRVKTIKHGAFSGCKSLTSVIIPESVTEFGKGPFYDCAAPGKALLSDDGRFLLNVNKNVSGQFVIPKSVKVIVPNAFYACTSLTSVVIPESLEEIKPCAFCDCAAPGKTILSDDGRYLLNVNKYISSSNFVIPDSVRVIAPNAFCKCKSLTSVSIHDMVTEIGTEAFLDCTEELTIRASAPSYAEEYAIVYNIRFQPIEKEK